LKQIRIWQKRTHHRQPTAISDQLATCLGNVERTQNWEILHCGEKTTETVTKAKNNGGGK